MKLKKKILLTAIAFGLSFWLFDALIDYCFFYEGTLAGLLIRDIPAHEIYMRSVTLGVCLIFGVIIAYIITKLKQTEKVYRDAEQRGRAVFDTISDAVFLHPLMEEGFAPFVDVNETACRRYGYTRAEFLTLSAPRITKKADAHAHSRADHRKKLRDSGQLIFEATHMTKSGKEFPVEINSSIIELGGRRMILAVVRDISDRKRIEKERLALERQMLHAQKLESLGVLAGGIAHDFNNLLMTILGNAELALEDMSPMSPVRENLREIEKTAIRAAELSRQMLAYSGKGSFVIQPIDLNELVSEMAHMLHVSISKRSLLKYNFTQKLPLFEGDATQLRQVVMNLITNASDAIGDQSGIIAVSTGVMNCSRDYLNTTTIASLPGLSVPLPEGVYVYLEVADTGCGMDRETQQKLFDPFFTTKFTGRGLGMAAVQGIVRGHNGTIKVYSEVGRGTTFKVLLPVSGDTHPARGYSVAETQDTKWRGQGVVLIADDEDSVRTVGRNMLEKLGFNVLTAADGLQAVDVFKANCDDIICVLLDLTMPHLNGEEAFREMRQVRPDIDVVITSGYNENDATQRFIGKGLAGFLQKPYSFSLLAAKMKEVLEKDG